MKVNFAPIRTFSHPDGSRSGSWYAEIITASIVDALGKKPALLGL